jgi:hypothetical protein
VYLKNTVKLAGAGLLAIVVAGCVKTPEYSKSQIVASEVEKNFGRVFKSENRGIYAAYDEDDLGLSMFRGYSEIPFSDRYTGRAPEAYGNALVMDFALDFKEVSGYPLYRIGLRPRKISLDEVRMLPDYVTVNAAPQDGRTSRLIGKLPASRALDRNGFIWTDYTYCSECFELKRIEVAPKNFDETAFEIYERGIAAARKKSGQDAGFSGIVRFVDYAQEGILEGDNALRMAAIAHTEVVDAKLEVNMIMPSRNAYLDFMKAYLNEQTAVNVMLGACGEYEPSGDPASSAANEKERVESYTHCLAETLEGFSDLDRRWRIDELRETEAGLAKAGAIEVQNRVNISSVEEERSAAYTLIRESYSKFMMWKSDSKPSSMMPISAPKKNAEVRSDKVIEDAAAAIETATDTAEAVYPGTEESDDYAIDTQPSSDTLSEGKTLVEPECSIMILCPERFNN